jgi:uncharacterized C2H2 Zn-finger protein
MVARCPQCGGLASQGKNYEKLLQLAEVGELVCRCPYCDDSWKPSPADQQLIAANLRQLIANLPEA